MFSRPPLPPLLVALLLAACAVSREQAVGAGDVVLGRVVKSRRGLVVATDQVAARVGARVLAQGGNAVDAAVAVAFALAVTHPQAGNVGGGGFMVLRRPDGTVEALDYRETAPQAFHPRIFLGPDGRLDPRRARDPFLLVGVPGTVRGLWLAHRRHGTRPWAELLAPAIRLAQEGFRVSPLLARDLRRHARKLARHPATRKLYFHWSGGTLTAGERFRNPDLARVLRALARAGPDVFYRGWIGEALVRHVREGGGVLTSADLAGYEAKVRRPLRFPLRGGTLIGMPPPSSGGVAVAQILGLLGELPLDKLEPTGAPAAHLLAEAMRRAFRDRARWLGDPDFTLVPVAKLLSPSHLMELRRTIHPARATPSETLWPEPVPAGEEGRQTTHFSILDRNGFAVANTYTLEQTFGGGIVVPGLGFFLNNELGDFNPKPGLTDQTGRIGTAPNVAEGGKRPLSSMSPTLYVRDGQVEIITGSPGGRTIISTVACVLFRRVFLGLDPVRSVWGPRLHHQWFPDRLLLEEGWPAKTASLLRAMGHRVVFRAVQGSAHSIFRLPTGAYVGVADYRRDGWAAAPPP